MIHRSGIFRITKNKTLYGYFTPITTFGGFIYTIYYYLKRRKEIYSTIVRIEKGRISWI